MILTEIPFFHLHKNTLFIAHLLTLVLDAKPHSRELSSPGNHPYFCVLVRKYSATVHDKLNNSTSNCCTWPREPFGFVSFCIFRPLNHIPALIKVSSSSCRRESPPQHTFISLQKAGNNGSMKAVAFLLAIISDLWYTNGNTGERHLQFLRCAKRKPTSIKSNVQHFNPLIR